MMRILKKPALQNVATTLFDDELVVDLSQIYKKDW
ncbi:MAG: hypothetical protein K0R59_118 [Sphingobacterium sp.]|jgi:hypothetical protein|nr:hypothetical protein [Sphingobacterium sp.]